MGSDSNLFYVENKPLPTCFSKFNFQPGKPFNFQVSRIYDPSKFWIVVKFQELYTFQKHLFQFYYLQRSKYKMPKESIQLHMYCVAFTNGNYYRGRIVGLPADIHGQQQVHVLFIDYGSLEMIDHSNVYYMSRKHCEVPQFFVRACLAEVRPRNLQSQWTADDVIEFSNLVTDKTLTGIVVNVYSRRQVIDIQFRERIVGAVPVHETLIEQGRAQYVDEKRKSVKNGPALEPKYGCAHLLPWHGAIESGKVPTSFSDAEFQAVVSTFSPIVSRYYKVNDF